MMQTFFRRKTATVPLLATALLWFATSAHAVQYGFDNISNKSLANAAIGEAQLSMDVTQIGSNQVLFTFNNKGPAASSITDVYFDEDSDPTIMFNIAQITPSSSGVNFSQGASPGNLPGGREVAFEATAGFTADSNPPTQPNGVNPGEWLEILFDLRSGKGFQDILDALQGPTPTLQVGIHVQGFADGGSESFVNTPGGGPTPTPEPGTWVLMGTGLVGLLGYGWRRRQHQAV